MVRLTPQQHLVAGTVAGGVSTAALYPLDLVKTRYQVHEGIGLPHTSFTSAMRTIVRRDARTISGSVVALPA